MTTARLSRTTSARMSSPAIDRTVSSTSPVMRPVARAARITPADSIDERDHCLVVSEPRAEAQNRIQRLLEVVRIQTRGRDPEERIEHVPGRFQVPGPFRDSVARDSECERSSSSVMSVECPAQHAQLVRRANLAPNGKIAGGNSGRSSWQAGESGLQTAARSNSTPPIPARAQPRPVPKAAIEAAGRAHGPRWCRSSQSSPQPVNPAPNRSIGHQHVLASIVGRRSWPNSPLLAAASDGKELATTSASGNGPGRRPRVGVINWICLAVLDPHQYLSGLVEARSDPSTSKRSG